MRIEFALIWKLHHHLGQMIQRDSSLWRWFLKGFCVDSTLISIHVFCFWFMMKVRQIWHIYVYCHLGHMNETQVCGGDFSKDFVWIRVWSLKSLATLSQPPLWVNFQKGSSTDCSNLLVNLNRKSHRGQMYTTRHIVKLKILSFLAGNICEAGSFKNSASYKVLV